MKMRAIVSGVLLGCAVASNASGEVRVRYLKGLPTFVSTERRGMIEVALPAASREHRIYIGIVALNEGGEPTTIGYENISILTPSGTAVPLLPYETLQKQARQRAAWANFFGVLAAGLNSYSAQELAYGRVGRYHYYSPVAGQIAADRANVQNEALFNSIQVQLDATMAKLDGTILRTTTVDPGASFGGAVAFDLPKGVALSDLTVTINFAGETHHILLNGSAGALRQATAAQMATVASGDQQPSPLGASPASSSNLPASSPPQMLAAATPPPLQAAPAVATATPTPQTAPAHARSRQQGMMCIRVVTDPSQSTC